MATVSELCKQWRNKWMLRVQMEMTSEGNTRALEDGLVKTGGNDTWIEETGRISTHTHSGIQNGGQLTVPIPI